VAARARSHDHIEHARGLSREGVEHKSHNPPRVLFRPRAERGELRARLVEQRRHEPLHLGRPKHLCARTHDSARPRRQGRCSCLASSWPVVRASASAAACRRIPRPAPAPRDRSIYPSIAMAISSRVRVRAALRSSHTHREEPPTGRSCLPRAAPWCRHPPPRTSGSSRPRCSGRYATAIVDAS
jgi:hypothetical protein